MSDVTTADSHVPTTEIADELSKRIPVCWMCDTPVTPYDMANLDCQYFKICLVCVHKVYNLTLRPEWKRVEDATLDT